jgi:hypothetical protein
MPEHWVGIIFEEREMGSVYAASWLCLVLRVFGTSAAFRYRGDEQKSALRTGRFFIANGERTPGGPLTSKTTPRIFPLIINSLASPFRDFAGSRLSLVHVSSMIRSNSISMNSAGLRLALLQYK